MAGVTRADAEAQARRTIGAYRDRVHEVRNDTDRLPPEGARIVDEYCSFDNDWQDLVQDAVREASFLGGMDDGLLLEYCAVCMELDDALGLGSWHIGRVDRIIGVADLSYSEKIKKAIEYSDILGEILEEVGDINALVAQMVAVSGVLIGLAATGYGAAAEALGLALLVVGASFSGTELLAGIAGLVKFFTEVYDAKTEDDLKDCGRLFGNAVAKIGVDGLFFVMSMFGLKKASARLTTKTVADNSLNARKWKGKRIEERELKIGEIDNNKALIGEWIEVNENMSALSRKYQKQITGQTGKAFIQNGVKFDGIKGNTLIDTKAHYSQFIDNKTGEFYTWFKGKQELLFQAKRQISSSNGLKIEWYFAERETMDLVQDLFTENDINITLIYEPLK